MNLRQERFPVELISGSFYIDHIPHSYAILQVMLNAIHKLIPPYALTYCSGIFIQFSFIAKLASSSYMVKPK